MKQNPVVAVSPEQLLAVSGGMKWEHMRPSENVEDRRGMSRRDSMRARGTPVAPLPPLHRTPGDLPSQAGLDDLDKHVRRRRR